MPVDLPPVSADTGTRQTPLERQLPAALKTSYAAMMATWGARWVGVQLQMPGGKLPEGLQHLLDRQNPALAQAVVKHNKSAAFVFDPDLSTAQQAVVLQHLDGQMLELLTQRGWLTAQPKNAVSFDPDEGSAAGLVFTTAPSVQLLGAPEGDFSGKDLFARGMDPVAFRWLTLCHEAAHVEMLERSHLFHQVGWSTAQNEAMNLLFFDNHSIQTKTAMVYAESFADTYGAMMALSVTGEATGMRQSLSVFQTMRHESTVAQDAGYAALVNSHPQAALQALEQGLDPHRTSPALDQMLADYDSGRLDLNHASPEALKQRAEHYASDAVVAFQQSAMGQALHEWAWASDQAVPGAAPLADYSALQDKETDRLFNYMSTRMLAYAMAAPGHPVTSAPHQVDPVMAQLAAEDHLWQQRYAALPATDHQAIRQALETGTLVSTPTLDGYLHQAQGRMETLLRTHDASVRAVLGQAAKVVEASVAPPLPRTLGVRLTQVESPAWASASTAGSPGVLQRPRLR